METYENDVVFFNKSNLMYRVNLKRKIFSTDIVNISMNFHRTTEATFLTSNILNVQKIKTTFLTRPNRLILFYRLGHTVSLYI